MREWLRRIGHMIQRRRFEGDLAEELEFHRAMAQRTLEAGGVDPADAGFAARRAFGSGALAQDHARDVWVPRWLQGLGQDVRLAVRMLWSARLVSAVAILSLALGIGANTAIFSLVDSLLLRSLPVKHPSQLALITGKDSPPYPWGYSVWEQIRQRPEIFEQTTAWTSTRANLAASGEAEFADSLWASGSFFETLGVPAILGRAFSEADDQRGGGVDGAVAVISYDFWQRHFAGAPDAIGRTLSLDAAPFTIIGITPPEFFGPEIGHTFDVAVPLSDDPRVRAGDTHAPGGSLGINVAIMARLKRGQTLEQATTELRGVQPQIREATLPQNWPRQFLARYLKDPFVLAPAGSGNASLQRIYERPLFAILVVVALVLVIACANVANLLLARAMARRHELSVRRALGASGWRLVRQFLSESAVLCAIGAAGGLALGSWGSRLLVHGLSTDASRLSLDLSLDSHLLALPILIAGATTLWFGIMPAVLATRVMPMDALKQDARATIGDARGRCAGALVIGQVALSLLLVAAAGLFARTFVALSTRPLGFESDRVLVVNLDAEHARIAPAQRVSIYERARDAVSALPGVSTAALSGLTPIVGPRRPVLGQPIEAVSGGVPQPPQGGFSTVNMVSPGWLETLGIPLLAGRDISDRDRAGAPPVVVVNQAFARKFLGEANPLGHTVKLFLPGSPPPPIEIVGLAADAVYGESPRTPTRPTIYLPIAQLSDVWLPFLANVNLSVRTKSAPALAIRSVAAAITAVDPKLALTFHTLERSDRRVAGAGETAGDVVRDFSASGAAPRGPGSLWRHGLRGDPPPRWKSASVWRSAPRPRGVVSLVLSRIALVADSASSPASSSVLGLRFVASLLYGLRRAIRRRSSAPASCSRPSRRWRRGCQRGTRRASIPLLCSEASDYDTLWSSDCRLQISDCRRKTQRNARARHSTPARLQAGQKLRGRLDADAVSERGEKMTTVVGHDDRRTGGARHLGDVRVVDAAAGDTVARSRLHHRESIARRQIVHGHPREDLGLEQLRGVARRQPELRRQPRRDRKELETAVPRRRRRWRPAARRPRAAAIGPARFAGRSRRAPRRARSCRETRSRPSVPLLLDERGDVDARALGRRRPRDEPPSHLHQPRTRGDALEANA